MLEISIKSLEEKNSELQKQLIEEQCDHNKSLNKVLSVHQQSLEHEFREEILFHFKGPVTEYSLLGDIQPVPDQSEVENLNSLVDLLLHQLVAQLHAYR